MREKEAVSMQEIWSFMSRLAREIWAWLVGCVPTSTEVETGSMAVIIGGVVTYLCGWDKPLEVLLVLMGIDYVSGLIAAQVNPHLNGLSSKRGFKGICKKVLILSVVAMAHWMSNLMDGDAARAFVIWFFIGNEGLSILENAANAGVPIPRKLKDKLEQLQLEKSERSGEKEGGEK